MARSWNLFLNASFAGAILWGLALLWTGQVMAQDELDQSSGSQIDQVQAVEYEGETGEPPLFEEGEAAAYSGQIGAPISDAMEEVRKAYLMQRYDEVLDLCDQIRRDYPDEAGRVEFYENVSKRRLKTMAARKTDENPYPRISELLPEIPEEQVQTATAATPRDTIATADSTPAGVAAPATGASQPMPLPPSMAPAPPRPPSRTGYPVWMYAVAGVAAVALILLILKLVLGRKGKGTAEAESVSVGEEQGVEAMAGTGDDTGMFDPLGGLSSTGDMDDPFATVASGSSNGNDGNDPFSMMFDEVAPPAVAPAAEPETTQKPLEEPAKDLSAFESLLDAKNSEPEERNYHHPTGPINFSFEDEEVANDNLQATAGASDPGVDSIMDIFGAGDDNQSDIPLHQEETRETADDVDDILTFDGIEEPAPSSPPQEAETKMEESVSDVFDEDFSISLDQSIGENTAMQQTQVTQDPPEDETAASGEDEGEDLLLFDDASANTRIADLHIDETIDLDSDNAPLDVGNDDESVDQTMVSPIIPEDLDAPSEDEFTEDASASELFERERLAGETAFNDNNWKSAVHHLTIAAALQPESAEVKALLREASRQSKMEAEVSER